jgi:hypothetical protein
MVLIKRFFRVDQYFLETEKSNFFLTITPSQFRFQEIIGEYLYTKSIDREMYRILYKIIFILRLIFQWICEDH